MCAMASYKVPSEAKLVREENPMGLLPGFRFHPTDEEIIVHYLMPKVMNNDFSAVAIGQVDFNKCEPWDLPKVANTGDTVERYYYYLRDKKYPTGLRTNRATKAGYWKATGKDREIFMGVTYPKLLVGMKKTLVFYKGRAPRGEKTNWVMHEFRLHSHIDKMPKDDYGWVVSRVFHKNAEGNGVPKRTFSAINNPSSPNQGSDDSSTDHELTKGNEYDSLPPLIDLSASPLPPPLYPSHHQLQDLKPDTSNAYYEDQLLYTADPSYYYPKLPDSLIQTHGTNGADGSVKESFNFKVEQYFASYSAGNNDFSFNKADIGLNAIINNNDHVEISYSNDQGDEFNGLLPSTMGSVQDLSNMWNV